MFRFLFLLPIIMCLAWYFYLRHNNWSISQGKSGFYFIIQFNLAIGLTLIALYFLTQ